MIIKVNGINLNIQQRGAGSPTLVFLHYWGGSSQTWHRVIDLLEPGFRTVSIDQRGWGKSERPESGYALGDLADDAQEIIRALHLERYILIGHSMGGKVAQLLASRRPSALIGLALVAPSPPSPMNIPLAVRHDMINAYASRESIIETVERVLTHNKLHPDDLETVIADSLGGSSAAKAAWPLSASQEDIRAFVKRIELPAIIVSGDRDRVDPPEVLRRELLPWIPQAQFYMLPDVGHLSPFEAPAEVAHLLHTFALSLFEE